MKFSFGDLLAQAIDVLHPFSITKHTETVPHQKFDGY
jgi:hypothetical protein